MYTAAWEPRMAIWHCRLNTHSSKFSRISLSAFRTKAILALKPLLIICLGWPKPEGNQKHWISWNPIYNTNLALARGIS